MNPNALDVFIFSYNRGPWMSNLAKSVTAFLGPPLDVAVHVFDDHSDDAQTLEVLERLRSEGVQIHHPTDFEMEGRGTRGGLHAGIDAALTRVARKGSVALLLQDDMQIVRPVTAADLATVRDLVQKTGNPFVYVNFLTGGEEYRKKTMSWCEGGYYTKYSPRERRNRAYTDVCAVDVDFLRKSEFVFERSEKSIDHRAAEVFGPMAWSPYPFTAMLPDPAVYREGRLFSGQVFSFEEIEGETLDRFMKRDVQQELPVAEKYLKVEGMELPTPWRYGVEVSPLKRIFLKIKKLFV